MSKTIYRVDRRGFLKAGAAAAGTTALFGCGEGGQTSGPAVSTQRAIKIGYVSPQTGALAGMAEADDFTLSMVQQQVGEGLSIDGRTYPIEVIVKDSQSNPNRASEVANELILSDEVDLMVVASTPENVNPVADACEVNGVPCLSTMAPWQAYFFSRGGDPNGGFDWTYHYFWGSEDLIAVFTDMWSQIDTNQQVGLLFPNDADGNALADPNTGFPPALSQAGYSMTDPGRYQNLSDDFTAYISAFRQDNCEIITGAPIPPDFTTFWSQAQQQGFRPKIVSIAKATLYPVNVETIGPSAHNLSSEIWWSPSHPFASSLTGQSAEELAAAYTAETGRQWTQPIGFIHSLFEVATDIMTRAGGPGSYEATRDAMAATNIETVVGPVSWGNGPVKNVTKTPLVGGQWRADTGSGFPFDLVITSNSIAPEIPRGGQMESLV